MPDLTVDEYRGLPQKELSRILREEALKICGESLPGTRLIKAPAGLAVSHACHCSRNEKIFPSKILLGILSLFRRHIVNQGAVPPYPGQ